MLRCSGVSAGGAAGCSLSQLLVAAGLIGLSMRGPAHGLAAVGALALVVAFASSTQDIVVDAWRIEAASDSDELGLLSAAYQLGYRAALLVTDALILIVANHFGWPISYTTMAVLMAIGFVRQPGGRRAGAGRRRVSTPGALRRCGARAGLSTRLSARSSSSSGCTAGSRSLMLAMISLYRLPEFVMGPMANPFYHDLGLSKDAVGAVRGSIGLVGSLARHRRRRLRRRAIRVFADADRRRDPSEPGDRGLCDPGVHRSGSSGLRRHHGGRQLRRRASPAWRW